MHNPRARGIIVYTRNWDLKIIKVSFNAVNLRWCDYCSWCSVHCFGTIGSSRREQFLFRPTCTQCDACVFYDHPHVLCTTDYPCSDVYFSGENNCYFKKKNITCVRKPPLAGIETEVENVTYHFQL